MKISSDKCPKCQAVLRNVQSVLRNVPGRALKPIPVGALKYVGVLKQKIKKTQTKLKGRALHWPNETCHFAY